MTFASFSNILYFNAIWKNNFQIVVGIVIMRTFENRRHLLLMSVINHNYAHICLRLISLSVHIDKEIAMKFSYSPFLSYKIMSLISVALSIKSLCMCMQHLKK